MLNSSAGIRIRFDRNNFSHNQKQCKISFNERLAIIKYKESLMA